MEFGRVVQKRRMIRAFKPDRVPEKSLNRILDLAQQYPRTLHANRCHLNWISRLSETRPLALSKERPKANKGCDPLRTLVGVGSCWPFLEDVLFGSQIATILEDRLEIHQEIRPSRTY